MKSPVEIPPAQAIWRDRRAQALLLAATLTIMANATISPALPGLAREFADHPQVDLLTRLLVPAPSLAVVFVAPLVGILSDRIGRCGLLVWGIALFVLAGSAGLLLPSLESMLVSRLVLGIAVAAIMTTQTALIGDYFSGAARAALTGLQTSARNFGGFFFISSAGVLAALSPRLPFAIYALPLLVLPIVLQSLPCPAQQPTTQEGDAPEAGGHPQWRLILTGLLLLQMVTNMTFFVMPTQIPFYLDALGHDSAVMTGTVLGLLTLAGGLAALVYGRLAARLGVTGIWALGYGAMALGMVAIGAEAGLPLLLAGAVCIGIGFAWVLPAFVTVMLAIAPARRRGGAGGLLTTAIFLGQVLSPFLSLPIIAAIGFDGLYLGAGALLATISALALIANALQRRRIRGHAA
ncbi:MFS transporter [Ruegeria pomeroyi]|uniref:MFS transporter n=1 Tax=Ruegeria pomeroyi TaxID=89184 RepID=UPI001F1D9D68|nr:MFS transporter [Ruegeria pomeroyi]MCE8508644.1 MFS transporter [Ruegeria pomeroyi]